MKFHRHTCNAVPLGGRNPCNKVGWGPALRRRSWECWWAASWAGVRQQEHSRQISDYSIYSAAVRSHPEHCFQLGAPQCRKVTDKPEWVQGRATTIAGAGAWELWGQPGCPELLQPLSLEVLKPTLRLQSGATWSDLVADPTLSVGLG